jgi:uncharacterized protein (DUF302 family)
MSREDGSRRLRSALNGRFHKFRWVIFVACLNTGARGLVACIQMNEVNGGLAMAIEGLISAKSAFEPAETLNRMVSSIEVRGLTVFARIDHAAAAAQVGLALRPTTVIIFGNARGGTPVMQLAQTTGIDLPLKALVWQDESMATWLSYNDPLWFVQRHGIDASASPALKAMSSALAAIALDSTAATGSGKQ